MLTAYFDDSGTHAGSPVVLMGGLMGVERQWTDFESAWDAHLKAPLGGERPPLKRFHMYDCEHGEGEFGHWKKAERDRFIYELREVIFASGLFGYACAIDRKEWDGLIRATVREMTGDAEQYCVISCILRTLEHAKRLAPGEPVAFVFDNRPHREESNKKIFDLYNGYHKIGGPIPEPARIAFESSADTLPLQAADLFAWEVRNHAIDWIHLGHDAPRRPHFVALTKGMKADVQVADREAIQKIAAHMASQTNLRDLANYLRTGE